MLNNPLPGHKDNYAINYLHLNQEDPQLLFLLSPDYFQYTPIHIVRHNRMLQQFYRQPNKYY